MPESERQDALGLGPEFAVPCLLGDLGGGTNGAYGKRGKNKAPLMGSPGEYRARPQSLADLFPMLAAVRAFGSFRKGLLKLLATRNQGL